MSGETDPSGLNTDRLEREPEDTMPPVQRAKWLRQLATLTPDKPEHRRGYLHAAHHIERLERELAEVRAERDELLNLVQRMDDALARTAYPSPNAGLWYALHRHLEDWLRRHGELKRGAFPDQQSRQQQEVSDASQ